MRKLIALSALIIIAFSFSVLPIKAFTEIGNQTIIAQIDVQENNDILFENGSETFVSFKNSILSWSGLMDSELNYLSVVYDVGVLNVNVVTIDNNFYTFSEINTITVYLAYEAPLYLPMVSVTLFQENALEVYSITNISPSNLPTFSFLNIIDSYTYDLGYKDGVDFATNDIYINGFTSPGFNNINSFSYLLGLDKGLNESVANLTIINFIPSILGSFFGFLLTVGSYELFGLSAIGIFGMLFVLTGILFVLKLVFGGS